jgi:PAS domain S-box-containing protein
VNERNLTLIVDTVPAMVWSARPDGSAEFFNQHYLDFIGLSAEQASGWGWTGAVHPEDQNDLVARWQCILASEAPGEAEARIRRHDGDYRWFLVRANPLRDATGNVVKWYGVNTDIEDQKRAEAAVRKSERQFRLLAETIPALVWRGTPEGELEYLNQRAVQYLGHTAESLTGGRWLELVHPDHRDATMRRWLHSASTGSSYEDVYQLRRADGVFRWIQSFGEPFYDTEGRIAHWYGLVIDIEDRKRAEIELRRAYDSFSDAQQLSKTGSFITDLLGDDHNWSEEAYRIFEFDPGTKVTVQRIRDVIHPDDLPAFESVIARGMTGENVTFTFRVVTACATVKHVRGVAHVTEKVDGRPMFVGALQDVTESVVAEVALRTLKDQLYKENLVLRDEVDRTSMFEEIVGASPTLKAVLSRVAKVAPTDSTVFISGETGTGKELIARAVHKRSQRAGRAFLSVNCAALAPTLISSELFGHEKGAFTGATQRRLGRFELADGGTIFLDEVGELLPDTQAMLLRVLQEREFERVGGAQPVHVNVRVIAATNRDLRAAIATGSFRHDLYYRLNVFPIEVPALRNRKDDLLMLIEYFVQRYASRAGKPIRSIDKKTLELLQAYDWPGNIRELQNVIERSVILSSGGVFTVDELWLSTQSFQPTHPMAAAAPFQGDPRGEREIIEAALAESRGRIAGPSGAAARLNVPPSTLESRIKALKINKNQFKFGGSSRDDRDNR